MPLQGARSKDFDVNTKKVREPRRIELVILKNRNVVPYAKIPIRYYEKYSLFQERRITCAAATLRWGDTKLRDTMRRILSAILVVVLLTVLGLPVVALDVGVSVVPVLPDNQVESEDKYFDLILQPGETQELALLVSNNSAFDIELSIEAGTATTNANGMIVYAATPQYAEQTLQHAFAQLADVQTESLALPAGATEQVTVSVTMPESPVEGIILGAISVVQTTPQTDEGSNLSHEFAYAIPVKLSGSEERLPVSFEMGDVFLSPQGTQVAISTHIRNVAPAIGKELEILASLYNMEGETVIASAASAVEIAPNSIFPFLVTDDLNLGLDPGDYRMEVKINQGEGEGEWTLEAPISLTKEQLDGLTYNRSSSFQLPSIVRMFLWILAVIVVVAVIAFSLLLLHIRRENKKYDEFMRRQQQIKKSAYPIT